MAEEHLDDVYGYLLYLCRNATLAEDLVERDVREGAPPLATVRPAARHARTWLLAIARTTALDWFRAEERRRSASTRSHPPTCTRTSSSRVCRRSSSRRCEPDAGEREVIVLRVVLELDGEAAARVLGISQTACSTRLSRALKRLEERMTDDLG